jgi:N-methylhydantoinase B/oxoprolinase/acetone carboxylase alpha subunit
LEALPGGDRGFEPLTPGQRRGRLGQRLVLRTLYADGLPVLVNLLPHGMGTPMKGLLGGLKGGKARFTVARGVVSEGEDSRTLVELSDPDQAIIVEASGGSGFGDPTQRPLESITTDLLEGYVTSEGLKPYAGPICIWARHPP